MEERICVVTGASSGLGLWTARELAARPDGPSRLALLCRDERRADEACRSVETAARRKVRVDPWIADLSELASVRAAAERMASAYPHIDALVNNAGAVFGPHRRSSDGIEMHLATNYAGHYLLTLLLLPRLAASGAGRVLGLTSFLHAFGRLRPEDLSCERWHHVVPAYARSKLAVVLFTQELARRCAPLGLTANCVDPGLVRTRIAEGAGPIQRRFARPFTRLAQEPAEAARPLARLVLDPAFAGTSGAYFLRARVRRPARRARDPRVARRLWERSWAWLTREEQARLEELLGIGPQPG